MVNTDLTTLDKLKRARIQIQRSNPFFAYLSLYLKFREAEKGQLPEYAGMGVNVLGELTYKKEFVDKLSEQELIGVLVHEILHLSLLHLTRRGIREPVLWNVAADVCVNQICKTNGYALPEGAIISDYNNECKFGPVTIKQCDKKTAEQVYNEIEHLLKKQGGSGGSGEGYIKVKGEGSGFKPFDEHQENKGNEGGGGKDGKEKDKDEKDSKGNMPLTDEEKKEIENYWKNKAQEALATAKLKGNVPAGIERFIGELDKAKVGWRTVLQKYIQRAIPYDYTYANPSKKSISAGYYMPSTIKDYIDIVTSVDTSGSIGQEEMKEFISEIVGISKAFSNRIKIRLLTHDVKVWDDLSVQNGNIAKINELKVRGGGGTSHKEVLDYVTENIRHCRLLICFTDGDSDIDEIDLGKYAYDKLFVISENGHDRQLKGKDVPVIKLGDFKYEPN